MMNQLSKFIPKNKRWKSIARGTSANKHGNLGFGIACQMRNSFCFYSANNLGALGARAKPVLSQLKMLLALSKILLASSVSSSLSK